VVEITQYRESLPWHRPPCLPVPHSSGQLFGRMAVCAFTAICFLFGYNLKTSQNYCKANYWATTEKVSSTEKVDVNALPNAKRKLSDISERIKRLWMTYLLLFNILIKYTLFSNLSPDVLNVVALRASIVDMEAESSQLGFWDNQVCCLSKVLGATIVWLLIPLFSCNYRRVPKISSRK